MTDENGRPPEPDDDLPAISKTVNQIVAWNIAWYRKAAGLTQEELGARIGRSKRNVSADERSWDGGHTREFNAHELAGYSAALGIPIIAFFLPPEDDGTDARYTYRPPGAGEDIGMDALMNAAMHDNDQRTEIMNIYAKRLMGAVGRYLHPSWSEIVAGWMGNMTGPEVRAEQADDLRADRLALLRVAAKLAQALEMAEEEAG